MMDGRSRKEEVSHQMLNLIPKGKEEGRRSHKSSEERELELRLGPPGEEDWSHHHIENKREKDNESPLSLGYFSIQNIYHQHHNQNKAKAKASSFLQLPSSPQNMPVMGKESKGASQPCCSEVVDLHNAEKKTISPSSANTVVPNSSQKRTAPGPVVGWPPVRSFRKNLASGSSSKQPPRSHQNHLHVVDRAAISEHVDNSSGTKGSFVKINMDGVPIGRKVDISAYGSYEKLSSAVDELFRDLLAAQRRDSSANGIQNKQEEEKGITGLLDGSGEYTLVYEDNEGDRMLVGDVPWCMFVSTVMRLRVLKSSDLSTFSIGSKQGNMRQRKEGRGYDFFFQA